MLAESVDAGVLAAESKRARARTESLLAPLSDEQLTRQVSPLQSPLVWDFAHIGHFEELWLLRNVGDRPPLRAGARRRLRRIRARAQRAWRAADPAARRGHAYVDDDPQGDTRAGRRARLELGRSAPARRLRGRDRAPARAPAPGDDDADAAARRDAGTGPGAAAGDSRRGEVLVEEGPFPLGAADPSPGRTTTSCPPTRSSLPAFRIDRALVTNADYLGLHRRGRLRRPRLLERRGLGLAGSRGAPSLRCTGSATATRGCDGASMSSSRFRRRAGRARLLLGGRGATPAGRASGCRPRRSGRRRRAGGELEHATGAVWQWTSSPLHRLPRLPRLPLPRVLRGVLRRRVPCAARRLVDHRPVVARSSFRNWDYPQRRQIFSGIRCARDV